MAGYIGSKVAVVSSGAERKKVFTATSGQTSFTGLSYTVNNVHVFQNGVRLVDGTDYTATNGNSITLTVGAATDDQVVVVSYNTFQTSDTVSASAGGTFSNAVTIDADGSTVLTVDRATSDGTIIDLQKSGSSVGVVGVHTSNEIYISNSSNIGLRTEQTGLDRIEPCFGTGAGRDNGIDLGSTDYRFNDLYLSGGVYLGGTGSANYLDDVEEGTFTPTFGSSSFTQSGVTISLATYRKVGDLVHVAMQVAFSGTSGNFASGDGFNFSTGLPFSNNSRLSTGSNWVSANWVGGTRTTGTAMTYDSSIYCGFDFAGGNSRGATIYIAITYRHS